MDTRYLSPTDATPVAPPVPEGAPPAPPAAPEGAPPTYSATPPTAAPPDWRELRHQERLERRARFHEAGVPVWGVLLIVIGVVTLLGSFGLNVGGLFGLGLGIWFVYLGARPVITPTAPGVAGEAVNWWLVGIGLLIGLGSISSGYADQLVFPVVLILVGLGIVGQQALTRPHPPQ
jgi:hypothetical protein